MLYSWLHIFTGIIYILLTIAIALRCAMQQTLLASINYNINYPCAKFEVIFRHGLAACLVGVVVS